MRGFQRGAVRACGGLLVTVIVFALPLAAQEKEKIRHFGSRGTVELGGSIAFSAGQPVQNDKTGNWEYTLSVMPYVGYFLIDGLELGVNPAGLALTNTGDTTVTQLRILFAPSYNFRTSTIITPYVEGLAGFTSVTSSVTGGKTVSLTGFSWGGRVGIKLAVVEHGLLNLGVQFLAVTLNPSGASTRNGTNEFSVAAGWTVWL